MVSIVYLCARSFSNFFSFIEKHCSANTLEANKILLELIEYNTLLLEQDFEESLEIFW